MSFTLFKDPIYGYIRVPKELTHNIIDSPEFQRLRRISQTSYSPLFSSAVHNRFVHSIGVYHLGCLASNSLVASIKNHELDKILAQPIEELQKVFQYACLLHDIGHSPFSHTGENYYLPHYDVANNTEDYAELHQKLIEAVGSDSFKSDVPNSPTKCAAPHEIMSAIVGLSSFSEYFPDTKEREFFARCITGYKYDEGHATTTSALKNCFIELLNSNLIDVDKLDYLIRDAFITGYSTVDIDYIRLLEAITIYKDRSETYRIGFRKSALSVIENAIYAHDAERKWIQNHPVILYNNLLISRIIESLNKELNTSSKQLFSLESLSSDGQIFENGGTRRHIRLLSDDDIVHLAKDFYEKPFVKEYFDRRLQMHALWKSEAEYKALILGDVFNSKLGDRIQVAFQLLGKYIENEGGDLPINSQLQNSLEGELADLDKQVNILDDIDIRQQRADKKTMLNLVECLNDFANAENYNGDFILVSAKQFSSSFAKPDFADLQIVFQESESEEKIYPFHEIAASFGADRTDDNFFHLFYRRQDTNSGILHASKLSGLLIEKFR